MKSKVFIVRCISYEQGVVEEATQKLFDLSNIKSVCPEYLLFKPNMLSARHPEEGVTTHPALLETIVRLCNSQKKIIGDSPANINKPIELYWDKCGYANVSKATGIPLVKFTNSTMLKFQVAGQTTEVPVTEFIQNFKVFNVAKLKTHGLTIMTAGLKNLYGLITGFNKSILHSKFISPYDFSNFLVSYYAAIKNLVFFNLVDAVVSMEGDGPAAGQLKHTGYLIGGSDTVAVDMVCSKLIGIKPEDIPYLKIYKDLYGLPAVEIIGDTLTPVKKFLVPGIKRNRLLSSRFLKPFLLFLARYFKAIPIIDHSKCRHCYACKEVCPVNAISKNLKFNRKKCINCLCCFEVCPYKAIRVKKSFIARLFT